MVSFESLMVLNILTVVLILIKRKVFLEKLKKLTLFDKIFISGFLILSLFSTVISIFFVFKIPFNPFALFSMEVRSILLTIFNPFTSLLFFGFVLIKWYFPEYKSTEPKVKTKKFEDITLVSLFKFHNVLGSGDHGDPYIIESSRIFPDVDVIKIKKSKSFILFRNHDLKSIKIKNSSNITIENCNFSNLKLLKCSEVKITDCTFTLLELNNSVKISIQNAKISYLKIFRSFLNEFDNCSIKRIDKQYSPDNKFNLKEKMEDKGRKSNVFQNNIPAIMLLFLVFLIAGDILFFSIITGTANFYLLLIVPFILFFILLFMIGLFTEAINLQRKVKKYYQGKKVLRFNHGKIMLGWIFIIIGLTLVNVIFLLLYKNILLWLPYENIPIFLISIITLSSLIITTGINIFMRNISSFKEKYVKSKNPIYPLFLIYNIFYANFIIFMFLSSFLFSLDNAFLILTPVISIFLLVDIVISISIKVRLSKIKESKDVIKSVFSITLIGLSIFSVNLISINIPIFISYIGLLNFLRDAFYYLSSVVLAVALAFIGFFTFPKFSKLLSAINYRDKEKYTKSIKSFQSVLRSEPQNEDILYNLGVLYYQNEEYAKSVNSLKRALNINENSIPTLIMLGYASAQIGDFETAINSCEKAIQKTQNPVVSVATKLSQIVMQSFDKPVKEEKGWQALSYIYSVKKDYNKVVETAHKSIELNPNFKEAWVSLAHGYIKLGEIDNAIKACNSALKIDSNLGYAWNQLGLAYQLKGDLKLGVQMLEKAVELTPKEHRIRLNLAKIYLDMKNYKQALESISISLKLKPNFQDAIDLRQQIYGLIVEEKKN